MSVVRLIGATVQRTLRVGRAAVRVLLVRTASSVSLQSLLLLLNICFFYSGVKKLRRARFTAAVKLLTDLDEEGLKTLINFLPAWVKFSDYERAKFLNDAAQMLWPAFDTALCSLIKSELEPHMRAQSPTMIGGLSFERLSFGHLPMSILGVRHVPSWNADNLGIDLDLDVRWAGQPDTLLRLTPSRRWMMHALKIGKLKVLPEVDVTPVMNAQLHTVQIACVLRVSLAPVLDDLPFVGAVGLSILDQPYLDFDLRLVNGPDIMSIPALATWLRSSLMDVFVGQMLWPKRVSIPILQQNDEDSWIEPPMGIVILKVMQAELPARVSRMRRVDKPLNPYIVLAVGPDGSAAATGNVSPSGEVCTRTHAGTTNPKWEESFLLVVQDAAHSLRIVAAHDSQKGDHANDTLLGRVDIPLGSLMREHGRQGDKFAEVTQAALKLRRATTKALSETPKRQAHSDDDASVYLSPGQSLLPSTLTSSSGDDIPGADGQGLASLLEEPPSGPHIIVPPQASGASPAPEQPHARASRRSSGQQPPGSADTPQTGSGRRRASRGDKGSAARARKGAMEGPPGPSEEVDAWQKRRAAQRARRRWNNARPIHSHVPLRNMEHRTAHEAALACAEEDGAWLPLLPIKSFWGGPSASVDADGLEGRAPRSESFFPTLPVLGSLMEGAATSLGSLFGRGASQSSDSDPPEAPGLWKAPASSFVEPPSQPLEKDPSYRHGVSSFFDWHHASRKQIKAVPEEGREEPAAQPSSPVHRLVQQMSLEADSSSDETGDGSEGTPSAGAHAATAPPRTGRRSFARLFGLKSSQVPPPSDHPQVGAGSAEISEHGAPMRSQLQSSVLGAVRLHLHFSPLSRTAQAAALDLAGVERAPDPERAEQPAPDPAGSPGGATSSEAAEASSGGAAGYQSPFAAPAPPRQPPQMGALIALLQTCNLTEARLEVPSARLRIGRMMQQTRPPPGAGASGSPVARAEWNFRACFALELPCTHEHLLVEVGDAVRGTRIQAWSNWMLARGDERSGLAGEGAAEHRDIVPWGTARVRIADVLRPGRSEGSWKLWRANSATGAPQQCGQVALRLAWLPCI